MKRKILYFSLCVLIISLLFTACKNSEEKTPSGKHLPEYEKLTALIGKSKTEALKALSLEESDLSEFIPYEYDLPMEISYNGVKLRTGIAFIYKNENLLNTISYRAVYVGNPEQAAKDITAVASELNKLMGTPNYETQTGIIAEMKEESLLKAIKEEKKLSNDDGWDITNQAPDHIKQYMKNLVDQSWWTESYGEKEPKYILMLQIGYSEDTDTTCIQICYTVKPERKSE